MTTRLATGNYHNLSWSIVADGAMITLEVNRKYVNNVACTLCASPEHAFDLVRNEIAEYNEYRQRHNQVSTYSIKEGK